MTKSTSVLWKRSILGSAAILSAGLMLATGNTGGVKTAESGKRFRLSGFDAPPAVRGIVLRACADCHSEETKWPWYSKLPPVSWHIRADVDNARAVMDLSRWNKYSDEERHAFARQIALAARIHVMPPPKYLWIHRDAKLSAGELEVLKEWAKQ
jgi:cytochrome c